MQNLDDKNKEIRTVPAANFCGTLQANVDNEKLSDAAFREFVRNTLPIVIFEMPANKN